MFTEQLCQVSVVHPFVPSPGQCEDLLAHRRACGMGRRPAPVAMDDPSHPEALIRGRKPPELPLAHPHQPRCFRDGQHTGAHLAEHDRPLFVLFAQGQSISHRRT